jgi:hypothetical protein
MYPRVKEKTEVGRVNAAVEAQSVEIDGLSIRYLAAGEGPPLVLLHGAGYNSLDWRWVLPALSRCPSCDRKLAAAEARGLVNVLQERLYEERPPEMPDERVCESVTAQPKDFFGYNARSISGA